MLRHVCTVQIRRALFEKVGDVLGYSGGRVVTAVALHDLAALVDQELLKVPGDVRAQHGGPQGDGGAVKAPSGQDQGVHIVAAVALGVSDWVHRDGDSLLHPLEQRLSGGSIDGAALKDGELGHKAVAGTDVLQSIQELVVVLVRLVAELVAREAEHGHIVAELIRDGILDIAG